MLLIFIFVILIVGTLSLTFIPESGEIFLKKLSLFISGSILILSTLLLLLFKSNLFNFQFTANFFSFRFSVFNIDFIYGLDGISIYFIILTALLTFLCILFIWEESNFKSYAILLFLLEFILMQSFLTLNILLFYIFFESILVPMYLIVGVWGSREKKIRAAYLLVLYTICSSLLMLIAILLMYNIAGTFSLEYLIYNGFNFDQQTFFCLAFFLSFASKIPMFPFHIWLPEAHVEAPTVGSVFLAGILLKLGVYGFLRYSLILFPQACVYFSPFIYTIALIGLIFASLTALKQTDLKKIVAYSSIAHMNLVVLGIFSGNTLGIEASILQSVSHGFVASALFFLIGIIYTRYHSRFIYYYGGIVNVMPIYSSFFLFFILSNIALPGTSSFIGEFLLLLGLFQESFISAIIAGTSVVLSGAYSLWLCNRVIFGNTKTESLLYFSDVSLKEFTILSVLFVPSLLLGLIPFIFLDTIHFSVVKLFVFSNAFL